MTQWEVVGVIAALIALMTAVLTPLLKLNTSITQLTVAVATLQKNLETMNTHNCEGHNKLWDHNHEQDKQLVDHETRLQIIEIAPR